MPALSAANGGVLDLGQYFMAELWTRRELKYFPIILTQPLAEESKLLAYKKLEGSTPPPHTSSLLWVLEGLKNQQNHILVSDHDCQRPNFPVLHDLRHYRSAHSNSTWGVKNVGLYLFDVHFPQPRWAQDWRHDLIIVSSEWAKRWLMSSGIRERRLHVVRPGVDVALFHPQEKAASSTSEVNAKPLQTDGNRRRFVVYSSNRLSVENGQDLVVAAFDALVKAHDESGDAGVPPPVLLLDWHTEGKIGCLEAAHEEHDNAKGGEGKGGNDEGSAPLAAALHRCFLEGMLETFDAVAAGATREAGADKGASGNAEREHAAVLAAAAADGAHPLDEETLRAYYRKVGAMELLLGDAVEQVLEQWVRGKGYNAGKGWIERREELATLLRDQYGEDLWGRSEEQMAAARSEVAEDKEARQQKQEEEVQGILQRKAHAPGLRRAAAARNAVIKHWKAQSSTLRELIRRGEGLAVPLVVPMPMTVHPSPSMPSQHHRAILLRTAVGTDAGAAAAVAVFPNRAVGMNMEAAQAMATGIPTVLTNSSGMRHTLAHEKHALVITAKIGALEDGGLAGGWGKFAEGVGHAMVQEGVEREWAQVTSGEIKHAVASIVERLQMVMDVWAASTSTASTSTARHDQHEKLQLMRGDAVAYIEKEFSAAHDLASAVTTALLFHTPAPAHTMPDGISLELEPRDALLLVGPAAEVEELYFKKKLQPNGGEAAFAARAVEAWAAVQAVYYTIPIDFRMLLIWGLPPLLIGFFVGLPFIQWRAKRKQHKELLIWLRTCIKKHEPNWTGREEAILRAYLGREPLLITEMQHRYRFREGGYMEGAGPAGAAASRRLRR
jgi:glycosyltransferase involved in cell wall biosynthesis